MLRRDGSRSPRPNNNRPGWATPTIRQPVDWISSWHDEPQMAAPPGRTSSCTEPCKRLTKSANGSGRRCCRGSWTGSHHHRKVITLHVLSSLDLGLQSWAVSPAQLRPHRRRPKARHRGCDRRRRRGLPTSLQEPSEISGVEEHRGYAAAAVAAAVAVAVAAASWA